MNRQTTFQEKWSDLNTQWRVLNTMLPSLEPEEDEQRQSSFDAVSTFLDLTTLVIDDGIATFAPSSVEHDYIEEKELLLDGDDTNLGLGDLLQAWKERLPDEDWSHVEKNLPAACDILQKLWSNSQRR